MAVFIKLALGSAELFGRMPQMIHLKLCIQKRGWRTWKIIIDMHNQVLKWLNRLNALDFQAQIKSLNATDLSAKTMNGGRKILLGFLRIIPLVIFFSHKGFHLFPSGYVKFLLMNIVHRRKQRLKLVAPTAALFDHILGHEDTEPNKI